MYIYNDNLLDFSINGLARYLEKSPIICICVVHVYFVVNADACPHIQTWLSMAVTCPYGLNSLYVHSYLTDAA